MRYLLLFTILILCNYANAQNEENYHHVQSIVKADGALFYKEFSNNDIEKLTAENVNGSPYLVDTFEQGEIFINNIPREKYLMRYNIYNEVFELMISPTEVNDLLKLDDMTVVLNNRKYVFLSYNSADDEVREGYFEIITEGPKVNLYLKKNKILKEGRKARTSLESDVPSRFIDAEEYYIQNENSDIEHLRRMSVKELSKALGLSEEEIKKIANTQDLKIKKVSDFIKFIELYNRF
jgi:hypothetical protein